MLKTVVLLYVYVETVMHYAFDTQAQKYIYLKYMYL